MLDKIREELKTWFELLAKREGAAQTAAEKVVQAGVASVHNALVKAEAEVVIIDAATAREYRTLLAAAKADVSKLDAAIGVADKAAAVAAAQTPPAPAPVVPPVVPASAPVPAAVDATPAPATTPTA